MGLWLYDDIGLVIFALVDVATLSCRYDVVIVQVNGSKTWRLCYPPQPSDLGSAAAWAKPVFDFDKLDSASKAALYIGRLEAKWEAKNIAFDKMIEDDPENTKESDRRAVVGSHTDYFKDDVKKMDCTTLELKPGDRIYIPMGVYHGAVTGPEGSTHLDFGFMRGGVMWVDLLVGPCPKPPPFDLFSAQPSLLLRATGDADSLSLSA